MKLLLQAFDRLDLDSDVTLGIIDDGSRMTALREFRPTMDRKEQAFFIGFCDHDNVIAHMQVAPIFVSPSTREGFGITFVAAMAADCVVITTEQEYSAGHEVIGDAGFIVDHSAPTLTNAITRALSGERPPAAPEDVVTKFDWDRIVEQEEAFYASLVDR